MKWWLSVFFFVNGTWLPGDRLDGWAPRAYDSEAQCRARLAFAERECRDHPLPYEAYWMCSEGAPAVRPPVARPDIPC